MEPKLNDKTCANCLRWEGHSITPTPWKARCSQIDTITEQTAFCRFWCPNWTKISGHPN